MPYFFQGRKISHKRHLENDAWARRLWKRCGLQLRLEYNRDSNPRRKIFSEQKRKFLGHFPTGEVRGWLTLPSPEPEALAERGVDFGPRDQ